MKKILLVDDESDVRTLLEATIARKGYEVLQASTAQEALDLSQDKKPDLILMDIFMPGDFGGLEATRMLKGDAKTRGSKIIVLTASNGTKQEALNAGADDYLVKPFSPLELLYKIDGLVEGDLLPDHAEQTGSL